MFWKRKKKLVTHSGSFHADDLFACASLSLYMEKNNIPYKIIRSRDESVIADADYVFDVGGVYDSSKNRFDHHQQGGAGKRENDIPYAAFGLVWKEFGLELCNGNQEVFSDIERRLVQPIDAIDNGISISEPAECGIYDYGLYGFISAFQNTWKEAFDDKKQKDNFLFLVDFFKKTISREIEQSSHRSELVDMAEQCYQESESKNLVVIPYHVSVSILIQVFDKYKEVEYVVCRSNTNWKVMALRKTPCSFENRKNLPQAWAGKRSDELAQITDVDDAVFCHNALFMAVAKSREGAMKLAEIALKN